jgi:hypothetical protein
VTPFGFGPSPEQLLTLHARVIWGVLEMFMRVCVAVALCSLAAAWFGRKH